MKKLLIPVVIAILAGVGGGSGFAYMNAEKTPTKSAKAHADSSEHAEGDSTAHESTDSTSHDGAAADSASHEGAPDTTTAHDAGHAPSPGKSDEHAPMTPADSLRQVAAERASLRASTKGMKDVAPATDHGAAAAADHGAGDAKAATKPAEKVKPSTPTTTVAGMVRDARNDALNTPLPEQRLAKIFSNMSAKDAAKVMEQMPDGDVRAILSLMNDRTAAAVLTQFPPARAAGITKGTARAPEAKP